MAARRRHSLDGTLKAVKDVLLPVNDNFEAFVVFIPAFFAYSHSAFLRTKLLSEYRLEGWVPDVDLELHGSTSRGLREKTALVMSLTRQANESAVWIDCSPVSKMSRGAMGQMRTEGANGTVLQNPDSPDSQ